MDISKVGSFWSFFLSLVFFQVIMSNMEQLHVNIVRQLDVKLVYVGQSIVFIIRWWPVHKE